MALSGADLNALLALSNKFKSDAQHLEQVFNALNSESGKSQGYWTGALANKFRSEWGSMQPHLKKITQLLHEAGQATKTHHDNISKATQGH